MDIKFTNTMGRKKEVFKPIHEGKVGIYTCGLTVYNYAHIGNLRAYVFADTLKRTLLFNGYKVKHVMNITDVGHLSDDADDGEDKMEKGAVREGKSVWEIAEYFTGAFLNDLEQMNVILPDVIPKATEHIDDMIEFVKVLEKNGYTYESGGNIYFDTSLSENYGKLAKLRLNEDKLKTRVGKDEKKKNYFDFALWLTDYKWANHAMQWDSPWGRGFPGWHIECSAMSSKYLGENFDIHTGGLDHITVHHVNEIAQSEAAYGSKWVNYWLHSDWLITEKNEKMAKSKENFIRLQTLIDKGFSPEDYRYYLLMAHYRSPLAFSFESLESARSTMRKLNKKIIELKKIDDTLNDDIYQTYLEKFSIEINDDLNTPRALAVLWEVVNSNSIPAKTKFALITGFDKVLGLNLERVKEETFEIPEEILEIKAQREAARKQKEWEKSDELRDILIKKGYEVLDTPEGTILKPKR